MNIEQKYHDCLVEFYRSNPASTIAECTRRTGVTHHTVKKYFTMFGKSYFVGIEL